MDKKGIIKKWINTELEKLNLKSAFVVLTKIYKSNDDIDPFFMVASRVDEYIDIFDISNEFDDDYYHIISFHKTCDNVENSIKFVNNLKLPNTISKHQEPISIYHKYCHVFRTKYGFIKSQIVEHKVDNIRIGEHNG